MTQTKTTLDTGSIPVASTTLIIGNKMKKLVENWKRFINEKKEKKSAVIIKGNPKYLKNRGDFYDEIKEFLENLGYSVKFDAGLPKTSPPKADLWIGHSRGADRLEGAVPDYAKAVLGFGVPDSENQPFPVINHENDKSAVGKEPTDDHFIFTDEMKDKIKEITSRV